MTPFTNACWDSDLELALVRLNTDRIRNRDYWIATVENIEAGYHPSGSGQLTMSDLANWIQRCETSPLTANQYKDSSDEDIEIECNPANRIFQIVTPR